MPTARRVRRARGLHCGHLSCKTIFYSLGSWIIIASMPSHWLLTAAVLFLFDTDSASISSASVKPVEFRSLSSHPTETRLPELRRQWRASTLLSQLTPSNSRVQWRLVLSAGGRRRRVRQTIPQSASGGFAAPAAGRSDGEAVGVDPSTGGQRCRLRGVGLVYNPRDWR